MQRLSHRLLVLGCCAATTALGLCQAAEPASWLAGQALKRQLDQPVSATWSRISVRRALKGFARNAHVAIVLDRRIDPSRSLELTVADETLRTALERIAGAQKMGFTMLGPVAYFGPQHAAERLRTVSALRHQAAAKAPPATRRKLLQAKSWSWPAAAQPRALLIDLAGEADVEITNTESVPHDLWTETSLPPLRWIDRLTLLAIQFDLTFELSADGKHARLVPLPAEIAIERIHPAGKDPRQLIAKWQAKAPRAKISLVGEKIAVLGRVEDHEQIGQSSSGPANKPRSLSKTSVGEQVYTLAQDNVRLDDLLTQLGAKLGLEIRYDKPAMAAAGVRLDQKVSVKVKEATLAQLLDAALSPAGLTCEVHGKLVEVKLKASDK